MSGTNCYGRGKIYKITSKNTDKIYIGSTTEKYLSNRIANHRTKFRQYMEGSDHYRYSFEVIRMGKDNIELIEDFPSDTKEQLHCRERYHIEKNKEIVVNKYIPTRTAKERYHLRKSQSSAEEK